MLQWTFNVIGYILLLTEFLKFCFAYLKLELLLLILGVMIIFLNEVLSLEMHTKILMDKIWCLGFASNNEEEQGVGR